MRVLRTSAVVTLVACLTLAIVLRTRPHRHLPHYNNSARARNIRPGTTRAKLVEELGDPAREENGWLFFTPSPNGRTIRAKLDSAGRVEMIDPGLDDPATAQPGISEMTKDQLAGKWKWVGIRLGGRFQPKEGSVTQLNEDGTAKVQTPLPSGAIATESATWDYLDPSHWNLNLNIPAEPDIPGLEEQSVATEEWEVKSVHRRSHGVGAV
jgi:hypothetical protein